MEINYIRISTPTQDIRKHVDNNNKTFIDICSYKVPFEERSGAKEMLEYIGNIKNVTIKIKSLDRISRDLNQVLNIIDKLNKKGCCIETIDTGIVDSNSEIIHHLRVIKIINDNINYFTKNKIREGVRIAQSKGLYQGRKKGTTDSKEKTLSKHEDIISLLKDNIRVTEISRITGKTRQTIYKVKSLLDSIRENNMESIQSPLKSNVIEFYKFDEEVKYTEVNVNDICVIKK